VSKSKGGERLPYLLSKLKAPRVLERLEQTAERARAESWPYEHFLESLLEAEVFARGASGARMRIRHAGFPALKTLEDFDWSAQPGRRAPARPPPRPARPPGSRNGPISASSGPPPPARATSRSPFPARPISTATASPSRPRRNGSPGVSLFPGVRV